MSMTMAIIFKNQEVEQVCEVKHHCTVFRINHQCLLKQMTITVEKQSYESSWIRGGQSSGSPSCQLSVADDQSAELLFYT